MARKWIIIALAVAFIGLSGAESVRAQLIVPDAKTVAALEFVRRVAEGKYADAVSQFDATMARACTADMLKQVWASAVQQNGIFQGIGGARAASEDAVPIIFVTCKFEKQTLDAEVVFDNDGKIGGLWFVPHLELSQTQYSAPDYVQQGLFKELEVTVGAGEWKLPGVLSLPNGDGPFPGVVLIHGSGPNDRDETLGPNKPFRDLAWGLASRGVAVLRYDKRTKVYAAQIAKISNSLTVKEEVLDDALAAVSLLKSTAKISPKRIFVLGHSLGGTLIPRIGKLDDHLAGLIVMAGATRPLEDVMLEQVTYLSTLNGPPSAQSKERIAELRRQVATVKSATLSLNTPASALPLGMPLAAYWLDLRGYCPAELAKSLNQPMLILQGGRDYQSTKVEYDGWVKALSGKPEVTFRFYPKLNHLFMEGSGKSTPVEYERRGPVSRQTIDDVAAWIAAH